MWSGLHCLNINSELLLQNPIILWPQSFVNRALWGNSRLLKLISGLCHTDDSWSYCPQPGSSKNGSPPLCEAGDPTNSIWEDCHSASLPSQVNWTCHVLRVQLADQAGKIIFRFQLSVHISSLKFSHALKFHAIFQWQNLREGRVKKMKQVLDVCKMWRSEPDCTLRTLFVTIKIRLWRIVATMCQVRNQAFIQAIWMKSHANC